jgi:undecaprenyl-diphosphatase
MDWLTALILGLIQGLTEFLPVSSSGHLELGRSIFGLQGSENLLFTVTVHGATVLSTLVIFYKDILGLLKGLFAFRWNPETQFIAKILLSMIPVAFLGVFFRDEVESFFTGDAVFVGSMLLINSFVLALTSLVKSGLKTIPFMDALVIGITQAVAVLPGISRSGATISTGILLRNRKEEMTRFSFLMVIIPILGANFMDLMSGDLQNNTQVGGLPLLIGFLTAFVTGLFACKWMIGIVRKGKLIWFALYCFIIGLAAILWGG